MLGGIDAGRERRLVVIRLYRHARLNDRRTAVQFGGDEVHGGPVHGIAGGERSAVRVQARVLRQKGGMDVQDSSGVAVDELGGQNSHETRENDQ